MEKGLRGGGAVTVGSGEGEERRKLLEELVDEIRQRGDAQRLLGTSERVL